MADFAAYRAAGGALDEAGWSQTAPRALARLTGLTGRTEPPAGLEGPWEAALACLVDREGRRGVASETVGSTSLAYAASELAGDYEAVRPFLTGTGLLCRAVWPLLGGAL